MSCSHMSKYFLCKKSAVFKSMTFKLVYLSNLLKYIRGHEGYVVLADPQMLGPNRWMFLGLYTPNDCPCTFSPEADLRLGSKPGQWGSHGQHYSQTGGATTSIQDHRVFKAIVDVKELEETFGPGQ